MRLHFKYRVYPMSAVLTNRSRMVGIVTHPLLVVLFFSGTLIILLSVFDYLFPDFITDTIVTVVCFISLVAGVVMAIVLFLYREKKFAQYDAEYEQLLRSMKDEQLGQE